MGAFAARYAGRCGGCDERILPGEQIVMVDDEPVHEECEAWALGPPRPVDVCPECWMVRPCPCQDGL